MPPGPAFIPCPPIILDLLDKWPEHYWREDMEVPEGYIWQSPTEGTGAGWTRPKGTPVTGAVTLEKLT